MRPKRIDLVDTISSDDTSASVLRGIRAGADWAAGFVLKVDPVTVEDLTGKTFAFQVRRSATDATIVVSGSTEDGRICNGGTTGAVTLSLPHAMTVKLTPARAVWGLYETTSGASVPRIEGEIDIVKAVVR